MRVALVHNQYRVVGGEESHLELLERGLLEAGVEVARYERRSAAVRRRRRLAVGLAMTYSLREKREFARWLSAHRITVAHFHNLLPILTPSVLHAAKEAGVAVVLTLHNFRFVCPTGTLTRNGVVHTECIRFSPLACALRNSRGRWSESLAYGFALELHRRLGLLTRWVDAFIAPSDFIRDCATRSHIPSSRVRRINHGLPVPPFEPGPARFGLYAGRLSSEKGAKTFLRAAAAVPDVPLVIAGDGPLRDELAAGAPDNVTFVGKLSREDLDRARADAAFVVVPSECPEVAPLSVLEALVTGRPVIGTRIGSIPEFVSHERTGLLVHPGDADDLAAALARLWRDRDLSGRYGREAHAAAARVLSLRTHVGQVLGLYEEVAPVDSRRSRAEG